MIFPVRLWYTARMARKRKPRKNAKHGAVKALFFAFVVVVALGALFYLHTERGLSFDTVFEKLYAVSPVKIEAPHTPAEESLRAPASEMPHTAPVTAPAEKASPAAVASDALVVLPFDLAFPRCAAIQHKEDHELRYFSDYALCYRESYELAEWSAYCLERAELVKNASRSDDFRPDPAISTESASLADYKRSGYDRGHLAPAADFAYSPDAMSETFYMSNMTPQAPAFNRGIWQQLEAQVRVWASTYGRAYVVTGPVLEEPAGEYAVIGENAVSVPRAFYKVVLVPLYADEADAESPDDCADVAAFAFIIPNEKCSAGYASYAVTVDEVEARTGIDFFYQLNDAVEARIEAQSAAEN